MYDPKSLEAFFDRYLPAMKVIIEDQWANNRQELERYLNFCLKEGVYGDWARQYLEDMIYWTKTASHKYTDPWSVL